MSEYISSRLEEVSGLIGDLRFMGYALGAQDGK